MIDYRLANLESMKRAVALHAKLGTDATKQVDVYSAIENLGVTLAFLPLANLSGAYLPATEDTGGRPGIVINSKHPRSRQRYSAGHELGHHLRDGSARELIVDHETEYHTRAATVVKNQREATAEAFAAWFLMPRRLVKHLMSQLSIEGQPTAEEAYRLSLELGTSYLATVGHLRALKLMTREGYRRLAKVPPKWIKRQLAAHGPGDSWGDVWLVRGDEGREASVTPRPGDEIVVELREVPTSGYMWRVLGSPNHVQLLGSEFEEEDEDPEAEESYGGEGRRRIVLRADRPGHEKLMLAMTRSWETDKAPERVFALYIAIEKKLETQLAWAI